MIALLLAVAAFAPADAAPADAAEIAAILEEARGMLGAGRADRAAELLLPRVDEDPAAIAPLLLESLRRAQRFADGRALVARLDPAADAAPALVVAIAQWEAEEGWARRAAERLDAAIALRPEQGSLLAARARLAASTGEPELSLELAARAIAAGEPAAELAWLRGSALLELGRAADATALLAPLLAENPGHLAARLALARIARARGDRAGAIEALWRLLERDPDHAAALGELGSLLVRDPATRRAGERALGRFRELRDRRERIERLVRERREGRDDAALRRELARLLREDRRPAEALVVAEARAAAEAAGATQPGGEEGAARGDAGSRAPADAGLLAEAGRALVALGEARAAVERFAAALGADPSLPEVRLDLAEALLSLGDTAGAGTALARCRGAVDPRRHRLAEIEVAARADPSWSSLGPALFALLEEDPDDLVPARALADAAVALGGDRDPGFRRELARLRAEHPRSLAPLLAEAWIAAEAAGADPAGPELAALAERLRHRSGPEPETDPRRPDTDHPECWQWLARYHDRRGETTEADRARQHARRARALTGPPAE